MQHVGVTFSTSSRKGSLMRRVFAASILCVLFLQPFSATALSLPPGSSAPPPLTTSLASIVQPLFAALANTQIGALLAGNGARYAAMHAKAPVFIRPPQAVRGLRLPQIHDYRFEPRFVRTGIPPIDLSSRMVHSLTRGVKSRDPLAMRPSGTPSSAPMYAPIPPHRGFARASQMVANAQDTSSGSAPTSPAPANAAFGCLSNCATLSLSPASVSGLVGASVQLTPTCGNTATQMPPTHVCPLFVTNSNTSVATVTVSNETSPTGITIATIATVSLHAVGRATLTISDGSAPSVTVPVSVSIVSTPPPPTPTPTPTPMPTFAPGTTGI